MLVDGRKVSGPMEYDLCIIGAGAAGITIAREFVDSRVTVGLVESGGLEPDLETLSLYEGETSEAIPSSFQYLTTSRVRYFGGTTNVWNGWTRPLDPLDFRPRKWVGDSGWPMDRDDLAEFYERAARICQVPGFRYEANQAEEQDRLLDRSSKFVTKLFHYSPPTRFGNVYRKELNDSKNVSVHLHANVTDLRLDQTGKFMKEVEIRTISGRRYSVRAKAFIIACGGIENARLLLSSRDVQKHGVGNQFDMVGRYFMDHPVILMADAVLDASRNLGPYIDRFAHHSLNHKVRKILSPTQSLQEERRILNFAVLIRRKAPPLTDEDSLLARLIGNTKRELRKTRVELRVEQAPDPENRVVLSDRKDRFGNSLPKLVWKLNPIDLFTAREGLRIFANELGANDLGRVKSLRDNFERHSHEPPDLGSGCLTLWHHHMGGTRMHADPRRGVVDSDCKVHGVANLYVAGSSVFPTSGFANPTLTIVALATRLADEVKAQLTRLGNHA
jgi:choline dehydrogenase-like flavoprotein